MRKFIFTLVGIIFIIPTLAFAQLSAEDSGLATTAEEVYGTDEVSDVGTFIGKNIITPALSLVGVIFLLLIIYAGFLWMTAGGNSEQVGKAKNIMIAAITGVVLISAAYAITKFVFDSLA